jgi:serine O-acetyltransferase
MRMTLDEDGLTRYTSRQLSTFFPDKSIDPGTCAPYVKRALERLEHCFSHIRAKYFFDGTSATFDHLHTDQYAMYLYFLANSVHRQEGDPALARKVYALNKALHGLDVFYEVELPDIFCFQHAVGTVIGRAKFANYLFVYQRCSIGGNLSLSYPTFGEGVVMFGGSAVLGRCHVGSNCWISAGTTILDQSVKPGTVVFGRSPELRTIAAARDAITAMFRRL